MSMLCMMDPCPLFHTRPIECEKTDIVCVVIPLELNGLHATTHMRMVRRRLTQVEYREVGLELLKRRVHLVPLSSADEPETHLLVNDFIFHAKADAEATTPTVYCSCPVTDGCVGRTARPAKLGMQVTCPECQEAYNWV